jgi:hypothetical protein
MIHIKNGYPIDRHNYTNRLRYIFAELMWSRLQKELYVISRVTGMSGTDARSVSEA